MSSMSDLEAGQLIEQVKHNTARMEQMERDINKLKSAAAYGRGVLAGAVLAASALGGFIWWLLGKVM